MRYIAGIIKICLVSITLISLTACHSSYLSIDYKVYNSGYAVNSLNEVAFILKASAYYNAKGIARFPDGGLLKVVYNDVSLFMLNIEKNSLKKVVSLNDFTKTRLNIASSLRTLVVTTDSAIYFRINPIIAWDNYLSWSRTKKDSTRIKLIKEKYSNPYKINRNTKQMRVCDSTEIYSFLNHSHKYDISFINKHLDSIPLKSFGINIMKIAPKSKKSYIEETIYLENKSALTRRAVVEQIISKLSKDEIKKLLYDMDSYKENLTGSDSLKYELFSKDTYRRIQSYL